MYLCNVSQTGDMKKLATLLKLSFIVLGWIVFILLSYVAFKDEKTNVLITMKDSLRIIGKTKCERYKKRNAIIRV